MEGLRNQSLRHWVRVSSVTTFRVITKQGGDGGIHHHMCTQGRYLRSPTSPVLAVHCRHSIKRKHATSQRSRRGDKRDHYSHPPRAHTTKTSKPITVRFTDYTSCQRPAVIIVIKRRNLECQVLSKVWAHFARTTRRRRYRLSHCQFLRVFITGHSPRART